VFMSHTVSVHHTHSEFMSHTESPVVTHSDVTNIIYTLLPPFHTLCSLQLLLVVKNNPCF